jgi:hypothetical protein
MFGYLIAIVIPFLPMLQQGRVIAACVTILMMLSLVLWPLASLIAVIQTRNTHIEDKRHRELVEAQERAIEVRVQAVADLVPSQNATER